MASKKRKDRKGLRGLGVAAAAQPVDFRDAVEWLKEVKKEFADDVEQYRMFLQAMQDHKAKRIGIDDLIARVTKLFRGHGRLIPGFNLLFVPQGYARSRQIHKDCDVGDRMDKEGGRGQHNDFTEIMNPEKVSNCDSIWIRQSLVGTKKFPAPADEACKLKETVKCRESSLLQHLDKCVSRCELCAHVKYPIFNRAEASRGSTADQERAKANLENIYDEIFGMSAQGCSTSFSQPGIFG